MSGAAGKPAEQTSSTGTSGAGDAVTPTKIDLEADLGTEGGDNGGEGTGDGSDANNSGAGAGLPDPSDTSTEAVVARALAAQEVRLAADFDRRVNQAVDKVKRKLGKSTDPDDDDGEDEDGDDGDKGGKAGRSKQKPSGPVGATKAEVAGARRAFRDSLGDHIKIIGQEERDLVNELGFAIIGSAARKPIEDEYDLGEETAEKVAGIIKKTRDFYSQRTVAVMTRQGAIKQQQVGQSSNPGAQLDDQATAQAKALAKDRELNPGRYNPDGTRK